MNPINANATRPQANGNPAAGGAANLTQAKPAAKPGQGTGPLKDALKSKDPSALKQALGPQLMEMLAQMLKDPLLRQGLVHRFGEQNVQRLDDAVKGNGNAAQGAAGACPLAQGTSAEPAAVNAAPQAAAPCGANAAAAPQAAAAPCNGGQADARDGTPNGLQDFLKSLLDGAKQLFAGDAGVAETPCQGANKAAPAAAAG